MTYFVFPHNTKWEMVHIENKIRSSSLLWKTESPLISQRKFPHKIGNGSMSTGSDVRLWRHPAVKILISTHNKQNLWENDWKQEASFIFRLYTWNIYILIKTSVYRCSSSNRKHPLISLVMFIIFVFPLLLIKWTSFDHKMAQKPQPQVL